MKTVVLLSMMFAVIGSAQDSGPVNRFNVVSAKIGGLDTAMRVDTVTGKAWVLRQTEKGVYVWTPVFEPTQEQVEAAKAGEHGEKKGK